MENAVALGLMVLITLVMGSLYLLLPRLTRRGLLFGVYVGEEASLGGEAERLKRRWSRAIVFWMALSLALGCLLAWLVHPAAAVAAPALILSLGYLIEYLRAYRAARPLAQPGPPSAVAALGGTEVKPNPLPYLALAFGVAAGLFALGFTLVHAADLPDIVPTHFGPSGLPDAFRPRSFWTVWSLPLMTLVLGVGLGAIAVLTGQAKRALRRSDAGVSLAAQQRFRRTVSNLLAVTGLLAATLLTLISVSAVQVATRQAERLSPAVMLVGGLLTVVALGGTLLIALRFGQGGARLEAAAAGSPLTNGLADNAHWVLGLFYANREDPSIFVEHRFGFGYTVNFGNPKAVALLATFLLLVLGLASGSALFG